MCLCFSGFLLGMVALMLSVLHYGIAAFVLLTAIVFSQCCNKFNLHSTTATLIPIGVSVAEPVCMIITW